jgi:Flp pilus assembly protein TadG
MENRTAKAGLWRRSLSAVRRFCADRGGNTVVIFGLSAFVIFGAAGAAVDFSRVDSARKHVQDASDAALLRAMSLSYATSDDTRKLAADKAFDENFNDDSVYAINKALLKSTTGNTMDQTYTVDAKVTSYFAALLGIDSFDLNIVSKAQSQMQKSEIALVLDSTGSMASANKMTNLKTSVDNVLASLLVGGQNVSKTKVAIVPFNTQVRLTAGNNYDYIYYGTQSISEGCKSGTNGYLCNVLRDTYNKVCKSASNVEECKKTIKAYSQTYSQVVGGVTRTYYNTYMVANYGGTVSKYSETSYTVTTTKTVTPTTSTNAETGATSTGSSTQTTTTQTLESQSGSTGTSGDYNNAQNIKNTCFSGKTGCFTDVASGTIIYNASYSNGYGEAAAVSKSTSSVFGGGGTMWLNTPYTAANHGAWQGCVMDRTQPYDTQADAPTTANANTLYPATPCADTSLKVVQGLSDNITTARSFVSGMVAGGSNAQTNITIGVQWGMEVLSPSAPFGGGVAFNDDTTRKYMIVVTDGDNTRNRWWTDKAKIDARTALACTNAKAKGITIFVIKVIEGNSDMLRACATRPDYFYDLTSASQINTALSAVFEAIKKTRLTE